MQTRTLTQAVAGAALALALGASGVAQAADEMKIGAMRLGTSWYVFGATLAQLLGENLPEGSNVEVIAKGGGVGNPISVDRGIATIALANVATSVWAANGNEVVYEGVKHENIRALVGGLNSVWFTAMARNEFIERTGHATLDEILLGEPAPRIIMKPKGSSVPVIADMVLAALGTSRDDIVARGGEIVQVAANQIPGLVRDGRADLYFETALPGHPAVTETSLTGEVTFLDLPPKVLDALAAEGLNPKPLPQLFEGQDGPTQAVDLGTMIIAHQDLPDDMAYLITKTVCENKDAMATAHKAWSSFDPTMAGKPENVGIELHPGARQYFEEQGWL